MRTPHSASIGGAARLLNGTVEGARQHTRSWCTKSKAHDATSQPLWTALRRTTPAPAANQCPAVVSAEVSRSKRYAGTRGTSDVHASAPPHRSLSKRSAADARLSFHPDSCPQIGIRAHPQPCKECTASRYPETHLRRKPTSHLVCDLFAGSASHRTQYLTQYLAIYGDPGIGRYVAHRRVQRFGADRSMRMQAPPGLSCGRPQLSRVMLRGECDWGHKAGYGAMKYSFPHTACRGCRSASCRPAQWVVGYGARNTRSRHEPGLSHRSMHAWARAVYPMCAPTCDTVRPDVARRPVLLTASRVRVHVA